VGGAVFAASEDHGAETAVADGERVDPLCGGFFVPECEVAWRGLRIEGFGEASWDGESAEGGGGGSEKAAAGESFHLW
jgi:hypothetical protein